MIASARERLTFNFGGGTVPSRQVVDQAIARENAPTFATAAYNEPRDWGYAGLLAFTAVLMSRPQDTLPFLNPFHLAELCAIIGIAPMVLHRLASRQPVFRVTPETTGLLAFGAVILLTTPFSIWPGGSFGLFTDSYLKLLVVFVLMMNTLTTPKRIEQITWLIVLCCGFIAARSVFDYARGLNLVEGNRLAGPVGGIFGNPNDLAMNMVTFLPAAAVIALSSKRYSVVKRVVAALAAAVMLATVVFTKSRGGFLGLAAVLLVMVFLGRKVRPGFGTIAVVAVLCATPFMPASFWERMTSIIDDRKDKAEFTGTREARWTVMKEGLRAFADSPLTGIGAGQFQNYNPPGRKEAWRETHNAPIQVAAETGVFGLAAFMFLVVSAGLGARSTRRLLEKRRRRNQPDLLQAVLSNQDRAAMQAQTVAMTAGFFGWFVCSLFASVAYNWTFYYLLALIIASREMVMARLRAARALNADRGKSVSVPSARISPRPVRGAA
ncbi:MAG TPA: O-antigen ligase family protein [Vicinamibacterales bacterium]|nr:O-antigen ligase family protein [Vicinamibacterales bacterium]